MFRRTAVLLIAAGGVVFGAASAGAESSSVTRIESRPFYGAVVTIEEGVRVFRPLPAHKRIIINPEHRTPLNLTIEERSGKKAAQRVTNNVNVDTRIIKRRRSINHPVNPPIR